MQSRISLALAISRPRRSCLAGWKPSLELPLLAAPCSAAPEPLCKKEICVALRIASHRFASLRIASLRFASLRCASLRGLRDLLLCHLPRPLAASREWGLVLGVAAFDQCKSRDMLMGRGAKVSPASDGQATIGIASICRELG